MGNRPGSVARIAHRDSAYNRRSTPPATSDAERPQLSPARTGP